MISYDEICEILLRVDPSIRYVGILDDEKITFRKRVGLYSLLNTSENIKSATHALMRWQSRRIFASKFGMPLYAMAEYKLIKRVTMQLKGNVMLLVSMDKDAPHDKIIKKLLKIKEKLVTEKSSEKKVVKKITR
ncbi:MAG: hypothetical protein AAB433_03945 [Nitrospirota bacterium]